MKRLLISLLISAAQTVPALAAVQYFDPSATSWDQGTTANWSTNASGPYTSTWGSYDYGTFTGADRAVTITGTVQSNGLTFTSGNLTFNGGTLVTGSPLGGTLINVASGLTTTINSAMSTTDLGFSKTGAGTLVIAGQVTSNRAIVVSGAGSLLKVTGKLYSGYYSDVGVLRVQSGGTVELNSWAYDQSTTGTGLGGLRDNTNAIVIDNGTIRMNGTTSYTRGFTINAGGAKLEAATGANWTLNSGTALTVVGNGALNLTGAGTGSFAKTFTGAGKLTKSGAGTWTLAAANTHTGGTDINAGTIVTGNTGALGNGGTVTLGGGTLQVGASNITGVGALGVGSGMLDTTAGKITTTGAFTLSGGTWKVGTSVDGVIAGSFLITGGVIDLSALNLTGGAGNGFSLIGGSGSASNITFTGIDNAYAYSLNNAGDLVVSAVPEPATYGWLGAGIVAVAAIRRRRRA